jgi:phage shock protein C
VKKLQKVLLFFELRGFGVSSWFARKFGVKTDKIRLLFIYAAFFTLGSYVLIYLLMALILEYKHLFKLQRRKRSIWEL